MNATPQEHLFDIVADFDVAMLVTRTEDGTLRARPMQIVKTEEKERLWFLTSKESAKADEIQNDAHVAITLQNGAQFVSISGKAELEENRAVLDDVWQEGWKVWFPKGKNDPSILLIKLQRGTAEYWDQAGTNHLRYLFEAGKAYLQGTTPTTDSSMHAKVPASQTSQRASEH